MGRNPSPLPELQPSLDLAIDAPALTPEILPERKRKRLRGAINRGLKWFQGSLREQGQDVRDAIVAEALAGNVAAQRLYCEYAYGLPRKAAIEAEVHATTNAADLRQLLLALPARIAAGELAPDAAESLAKTAYLALQALELGTIAGAAAVETTDMREMLTERLIRAIEARKQIEAQKQESAQAGDAA